MRDWSVMDTLEISHLSNPVAVDVMSEVLREKAAEGIPVMFSSHQLDLVERLCDRVGIVRSGRMVVVGRVDELRAADVRAGVRVAGRAGLASGGRRRRDRAGRHA